MAELKGTFYGVSVGPGDPELMTLQAVRLIRKCPVLAAPQTASGQMLALDIARSALGEALDGKTIVPLYFAMSRDPAALAASHEKAAAAVRQYLDAGQDVAMLNIKKAAYLKSQLQSIKGISIPFDGPVFNEFTIVLPGPVESLQNHLLNKGIVAGYNLKNAYPELGNAMLVCATETNTKEDIHQFVAAVAEWVEEVSK